MRPVIILEKDESGIIGIAANTDIVIIEVERGLLGGGEYKYIMPDVINKDLKSLFTSSDNMDYIIHNIIEAEEKRFENHKTKYESINPRTSL